MKIPTAPYPEQTAAWPPQGRHILAQYDDASVIVYQAYRPSIGRFAARHNYFGGGFSYDRMSWFKPNFLWMMYRSGWGAKENQEVTLAVRLKRGFFERVLAAAVPSSFNSDLYADHDTWKQAVGASEVRLQWDPDHNPTGAPLERRAVQLGLRGAMLREYGREAIIEIEDISDFVARQRENAVPSKYSELLTPVECVYVPASPDVAARLRLDDVP